MRITTIPRTLSFRLALACSAAAICVAAPAHAQIALDLAEGTKVDPLDLCIIAGELSVPDDDEWMDCHVWVVAR